MDSSRLFQSIRGYKASRFQVRIDINFGGGAQTLRKFGAHPTSRFGIYHSGLPTENSETLFA